MSKIKRWIPFGWRNLVMGLEGNSRALAEAEYYWDGDDLEKIRIKLSTESDAEKELKLLALELKAKKITELQYDKRKHNILEKPWVNVISVGFNEENIQDGYFELDWNEWFIKVLEQGDFRGNTEEDLVNNWLQTVCQNIALEDMDMDDIPVSKDKKVDVKRRDDGKTEYS